MEALYPYFLTIHIICAIIFLGYIFTDVILLTPLKKILDDTNTNKVFSTISKRGIKIMPICLLLLIITGGGMISRYIGSKQGFFESNLQILLMIKMILALCILLMVIISLSCKFLKLRNPLANIIHPSTKAIGCMIFANGFRNFKNLQLSDIITINKIHRARIIFIISSICKLLSKNPCLLPMYFINGNNIAKL